MNIRHFRVAAAVALAIMAAGAVAQPAADTAAPGWQQALDAAWQRAPEGAERRAELLRAEAETAAANLPWAAPPAVVIEHRSGRRTGDGSSRESEVGVVWPLWLPGQRQSRRDAAEAGFDAARRSVQGARWRLAGELRQAALAVSAQEAELQQAQLQLRLLQALAEDVERRVRAGDLAPADAMAARAEWLQAQVLQQDSAQRVRQARERWEQLTGVTVIPPLPATAPTAAAAGEHAELVAARANAQRARRALALAESTRRDPPEAGVTLRRETDGSGSASSVGVSLRVPFASGPAQASALAQARADLELALAEEQRTGDRIAIERVAARAQVESTGRQLEAERARAGLLRQRAELIEISFRAGESALPDLLRALAAAGQAEAAVARQQFVLQQAQARLQQSFGVTP